MIEREKNQRGSVEIVSIDEMVPQDHLLRKIDAAVDFRYLYDLVASLYCANNGRPGVDPVVLLKIVLLQHIYGIPSLRQTLREVQMNIAYRWFLGYVAHINAETGELNKLEALTSRESLEY